MGKLLFGDACTAEKLCRGAQGKEWEVITSLSNSRIKHLVMLREKSRNRNKEGLFLAEGIRMFEEAPWECLKEVYYSENFLAVLEKEDGAGEDGDCGTLGKNGSKSPGRQERVLQKLKECEAKGIPVEAVSEEVFKKISDTCTPQGILFVMEQFSYFLEDMLAQAKALKETTGQEPIFLILEDIQDPGNLGTMLRTAEGAGANGVILSKGCVDIYNPKTIRSTMGSLYRMPFVYQENLGEAIRMVKENGITVYAAHLAGEQYFDRIRYQGGSAFLVGNEGNGLKKETADQADMYLKIPMAGRLESLNAAVSAALLLYRAAGEYRKDGEK